MANEMEWMGIILNQHKLEASMLTSAVLESADDKVRGHFSGILNRSLANQKAIFDVMNQKGWYRVEPAPLDQYYRIQHSLSNMQHQIQW